MSKQIDVSEAADWSDEEAQDNLRYLESRGRFREAAKVREERGLEKGDYPKPGGSVELDKTKQVTSATGTDDRPTANTANKSSNTAVDGQPHGPNSDEFGKDAEGADDSLVKGTVDEVLERVGDDKAKAAAALKAEEAKEKPRSSLTDELEDILEDDEEED